MSAPAKFLFDLDFAAPVKPKAEPTISPAEHEAAIAAAEQRGYQKGLVAAEAQARTQAERQTAAAFDRIAAALGIVAAQIPALTARIEADAAELGAAVARKLAPALIAAEPFGEVGGLVSSCLRELLGAPHVVVRVHEALYDVAREKLGEMARGRGFDGRLVVLGEAEIAPGDCRIEWADGGLIRDRAAIEAAIDEAVGRYIAARRGAA
ncbi:flagellar assembly protein H [Rhodoplanes serenus]|uniref:Flagellar assembly protein H n=1 Tax=Rhodoplanes serenus TaxID=200615 RepID=A0A9X4XPG4_9BRAD|nr:FliH/SctL family protein [Rhodoplanes serenus]MTW17264.1 flagellar assembly protein H [Rhodoplanes serenus]